MNAKIDEIKEWAGRAQRDFDNIIEPVLNEWSESQSELSFDFIVFTLLVPRLLREGWPSEKLVEALNEHIEICAGETVH